MFDIEIGVFEFDFVFKDIIFETIGQYPYKLREILSRKKICVIRVKLFEGLSNLIFQRVLIPPPDYFTPRRLIVILLTAAAIHVEWLEIVDLVCHLVVQGVDDEVEDGFEILARLNPNTITILPILTVLNLRRLLVLLRYLKISSDLLVVFGVQIGLFL